MNNAVNTSQHGNDYDCDLQQADRISDSNVLYDGWKKSQKQSDWKPKVQLYEMDWLCQNRKLKIEVQTRTYKPSKPSEFIIRERGKERAIRGEQVRDRVIEHALNDEVIVPAILPYLIYDNGASLKGKGVSFTRKRLTQHLQSFYREYGNDGYILIMDYSKYYDNIRHKELFQMFKKYVHDDTAIWLLELIINQFRVDVSYMGEDDYSNCMDTLFNSIAYQKIDKSLLAGEKFMYKHLDIGNQTSQSAGVLYPSPIDNYIKIVKGVKYYARYMDDSYIIHHDKGYLLELRDEITEYAWNKCGITISPCKTQIVKLSDYWRFMQIQYSLTDTGRVIRKISPKQLTRMRRKMKKLALNMTKPEFRDWYHAWLKSHRKLMSRKQYSNMTTLYSELLYAVKGAQHVHYDFSRRHRD